MTQEIPIPQISRLNLVERYREARVSIIVGFLTCAGAVGGIIYEVNRILSSSDDYLKNGVEAAFLGLCGVGGAIVLRGGRSHMKKVYRDAEDVFVAKKSN